jgi:hypothetical protein
MQASLWSRKPVVFLKEDEQPKSSDRRIHTSMGSVNRI